MGALERPQGSLRRAAVVVGRNSELDLDRKDALE